MGKALSSILLACASLCSSNLYAASVHDAPNGGLMMNIATGESKDKSGITGLEFFLNRRSEEYNTFWGLHGAIQRQKYGTFNSSRYGLGLSLNYQTEFDSRLSFGLKHMFFWGAGQTQKALDCLYCSNVEESYSGGESYLTVGIRTVNNWSLGVDVRLSDNRSNSTTSASDPWRVGPSYSYSYRGIPDPAIIFNLGKSW